MRRIKKDPKIAIRKWVELTAECDRVREVRAAELQAKVELNDEIKTMVRAMKEAKVQSLAVERAQTQAAKPETAKVRETKTVKITPTAVPQARPKIGSPRRSSLLQQLNLQRRQSRFSRLAKYSRS